MNWVEGRQGGGYYKLKLFESKRFKFDVYLLKFTPGCQINGHKDPSVEGHDHHRLNLILKRHDGYFWTIVEPASRFIDDRRVVHFRPDTTEHGLYSYDARFTDRVGYWLSIGWLKKNEA